MDPKQLQIPELYCLNLTSPSTNHTGRRRPYLFVTRWLPQANPRIKLYVCALTFPLKGRARCQGPDGHSDQGDAVQHATLNNSD